MTGVPSPVEGLLLVDKPADWTSHDVVGRVRRLIGQRRVGHAGTLDPMATGLLVLGVGRATRLLGHLSASDKDYVATVRLGEATVTDDAEGDVVGGAAVVGLGRADVVRAVVPLTGDIEQVPSAVSAVKVGGRRSYARVRAGEQVELAARRVRVSRFEVTDVRVATGRDGRAVLDADIAVTCSAGTYVRALARDLGQALGVGGHLTRLRRTRSGTFQVAAAVTLDQLAAAAAEGRSADLLVPLPVAVADAFPIWAVDEAAVDRVRHGVRLPWPADLPDGGPVGVFGPDGGVLALAQRAGDRAAYLAVLA